MKTGKQSTHVTPSGANIFLDLGYEPTTAAALDAESRRIIAAKLALRLSLLKELNAWINEEGLHPNEARRLGVSTLKVSEIADLKAERFTLEELVTLLCQTGKHIEVTVTERGP